MAHALVRLVRDEKGQDLIEYAFLAAFLAIAMMLALQRVGIAVETQHTNTSTAAATPQAGR